MLDQRNKPWALPVLPGEHEDALRDRRALAYFDWQTEDNVEFWRRIGRDVDVSHARILELGCGFGALSVDLARSGAAEVVGLDLDPDRISFAQRHVAASFPALDRKVHFLCQDIAEIAGDETFDFVVSKDTFEHLPDLTTIVGHIHRLLKPGGQVIIGTSPLYYSPFGDHGRYLGEGLPWLGAVVPEPLLFRLASRYRGERIRSADDVGLNKMTPAQFRAAFPVRAWRVESMRYNAGGNRLMPALNVLRSVPFLEKYATVSIYAMLTKL